MIAHLKKYNSFCQEFLVIEFEKRQVRNPSYSIRAFSRDIGVAKTTVSDVMNGLRRLSSANIDILVARLKLDDEVARLFKNDISTLSDSGRVILIEDQFQVIKDWYYLAILNLAKLENNQCSADWIAERLGLPFDLAEKALSELLVLGLIENRNGKLFRTLMPITTTVDIPSESIREHHRQSLNKAIEALVEVPVELRDYTTVTYALNPEKLPEVKKLIHAFQRKLGKMLPQKNATDVYRLNIQFFPLTKPNLEKI